MNDSPFRRIVLPALLASSAGFATLTWPLASDHALRISERLPQPLSRWADSALTTNQHKEFSIRYIGFAILSSVAIGIGTAEVMRSRQVKLQRHQGLLDEVLAEPEARPLGETSNLDLAQLMGEVDRAAAPNAALDWDSLLQAPPATASALDRVEAGSRPAVAIDHQALYQLQAADERRCLALAIEGEYYCYYRHRPSLDKARSLVQLLHQRGQRAIATLGITSGATMGNTDYVVWVHQPDAAQATPWPQRSAG